MTLEVTYFCKSFVSIRIRIECWRKKNVIIIDNVNYEL
jgi:hypothetical protein